MLKFKILFVMAGLLLLSACGNSDMKTSQEEEETAIIVEADSLTAELSASGDAVESKVNELQATMDSLKTK